MIFKDRLMTMCNTITRWGLFSIVFFIPIYFAWLQENYTVFDLNKSVALHFLLGIVIIAWLVEVSFNGVVEWRGNKKFFILGISVGLIFLISTLFSLHPIISLWGSYERQQGLYNLWHYLALTFFIVTAIRDRYQLQQLLIALLLGSVFAALYGLLQLFNLDFLLWGEEIGRLFSSFGQPNFFGHYLAVLIPLTVYAIVYISKNVYIRLSFCLLLLAQLVCLVFTYSRGAWVALAFTVFLFTILLLVQSGKKILAGLIVLVAVLSITFLSLPVTRQKITEISVQQNNKLIQRVLSTFDLVPGSARTRSVYWQAAITNFKESSWQRKLIGVGPDVEPDVFIRYYRTEWAFYEKMNSFPDRAHNFILDILLQFGLLGLLGLGFFMGYIVWNLIKLIWYKQKGQEYWLGVSILAALCIYAINNLFSFSLVSMNVVLYSLLGMAWLVGGQFKTKTVHISLFQPVSRWILTITISAFIISLLYGYNIKPLFADYYYFKVKKAEARFDCRGVLDNMEKVLEWYPVSHYYARAYISHGTNCFSEVSSEMSKKQLANNLLEQAKILSESEPQFYTIVDLAHLYSILGIYVDKKYLVEAEVFYKQLLEINPWMTFVYQDYGRMKLSEKKYDEALDLFNKGLEVTPPLFIEENKENPRKIESIQQMAYFYQFIGSVYYQKIDFPNAAKWYKKSIETNPTQVSVYKDIADLYSQWNNISEAIYYTKAAYIIDTSNSYWSKSLALLYQKNNDLQNALFYANQALSISPDDESIKKLVKELESQKP
jgi:tetratricopeptide (TPR) repeat protein